MTQLQENSVSYMRVYEIYTISVEERVDDNTKWEIVLPKEMTLISAVYIPINGRGDRLTRKWEVRGNQVGSFEIICNRRKLCCNKQIMQSKVYSVYVQ